MSDMEMEQRSEAWDPVADFYDDVFASFTAKFAYDALRLAGVRKGHRVLDVAAGTGALSLLAAGVGADVLATDFSPGMLARLTSNANRCGFTNVRTAVMDGQALDVEDETFDAAFSVFGLMFFPDRAAGFRELHRALKPGGRAAVVAWSTMDRLRTVQAVVGSLLRAVPDLPRPEHPSAGQSLSDRHAFRGEMQAAGFAHVNLFTVTHVWTFDDPDQVFEGILGVSPALISMLHGLTQVQMGSFREAFLGGLRREQGEGPYGLEAEAHIAVGRK